MVLGKYHHGGIAWLMTAVLTIAFMVACDDGSFSGVDGDSGDGDASDGDLPIDGDDPADGDSERDIDIEAFPNVPPKKVALYYDFDPDDEYGYGKLYAQAVRNLLGHFSVEVDIQNAEDYGEGDLDYYDAAIFIGSTYDIELPTEFYSDFFNATNKPILWIGTGINRYFESGSYNAVSRFGFEFIDYIEREAYGYVVYKGTDVKRDRDDEYFIGIDVVDSDICEEIAYLENDIERRPYLVRSDNFWYMTVNPFAYMADDVMIAADILHDFLDTEFKPKKRALIRLEDINSGSVDTDALRAIADKLHEMGVPFSVGVIPVYLDPQGVFHDAGTELRLSNDRNLIATLNYLQEKGGTLLLHGYTHQYDGQSAVDWEFWDEQYDYPVDEDSWDWAADRVDAGIAEFEAAMGFTPDIWETPHYEASFIDYFAFASRFDAIYEQLKIYDSLEELEEGDRDPAKDVTSTTMPIPYTLFDSSYGFAILPENLGYIDVGENDDYGVSMDAVGKLEHADSLAVVRDGVASFFFHHWQPLDELYLTVEGLQQMGFEFVSPYDLLGQGPPPYADYDPTDGDSPDGDIPDGDDEPADGDNDFPDQPLPCPNGPNDCPWGLGCHNNFCGSCTDSTECRGLDACATDGSCGPCGENAACREGETCREGFCMQSRIPQLNLIVDPAHFAEMIEGDNIYMDFRYPCKLVQDGVTYVNGELRLLGASSRMYPKKGLRIEFPEDAPHPGYSRKVNLKADWNDPTLMRSFLSFETARRLANVPAPRTRYKWLNINGEPYGLMLELERIGPKFLEINGRNRNNALYESNEPFDTGALTPCPDLASYMEHYSKKAGQDRLDYSDLIHFIEDVLWTDYEDSLSLEMTSTELTREIVHVEQYLAVLASMVMIQNIDYVASNFHFSWQMDAKGKYGWEFYPWDMDISFGCVWIGNDEGAPCTSIEYDDWHLVGVLSEEDDEPIYPNEVWFNMLIHLLLNDPEYRPIYKSMICEMADSEYWNERLPDLIAALQQTISASVEIDPMDMNESMSDFQDAIDGILGFIPDRARYLKSEDEVDCN